MELQTIAVMGKFLVNSIFPFFKESKALGLIKNDTLEISDDLFAKLYDSVKKVFIKDERRSIVAQLEELNKNPNDNVLQATPKIAIAQKLQEKGEFYNEIQSVVAEIENKYQEKTTEIINELKIKGVENTIEQGVDNELEGGARMKNKAEIDGNKNYVIQGKGNKLK